jgi:hypothetical protein
MESRERHKLEAAHIGDYLLGIPVGDAEKNTYSDAMEKLNIPFSEYEQHLWKSMMKSKMKMAFIDAGLAFKHPNNNARRKIFTMLAILEASPDYTSYFLSRNFSGIYFFKVGLVGIRAAFRAVIGVVIINNIKRKCS